LDTLPVAVSGSSAAVSTATASSAPAARTSSFSPRRFDTAEALAIGLITRVVPAESLLDSALAIAASIKQHPPLSVSLTKKGMWLATETPSLAASIELENRQ
jgi:enoyl-CoA hydratase/carnithine racemase